MLNRERIDGGGNRLLHAMLAFPIAALIGFGGNVLFHSAWRQVPSEVSPQAPVRDGADQPAPTERQRQSRPAPADSHGSRTA